MRALHDHLRAASLEIDYAVVVDQQYLVELAQLTVPAVALVAVRVGNTRLIDNMIMESHEQDSGSRI